MAAVVSVNIDDQSHEMNSNNIIEKFFQSKKNSNCILELEELLLANDEHTILTSIYVAQDLFVQILEKDMISEDESYNQEDAQETYRLWLMNRYQDFKDHLIEYLQHVSDVVQEGAFTTLMKFVKAEGENPMQKSQKYSWYFPQKLFEKLIIELSSRIIDHHHLIEKLQEYTCYDDIKIYLLKAVLKSFENDEKVSDVFLTNCFQILSTIQFPKNFASEENSDVLSHTYVSQHDIQRPFYLIEKIFKKIFSSVWYRFLRYELPLSLHRKVLIVFHKRVLPHLTNPCLVTDFLTQSYNKGGVTSLLALNSLFFLIQHYNIEYPDFFQKLYALFNEEVVNSKFNARFFTLSNLFLCSTHLPSHIVASFVKRLSRLALSSSPNTILVIISFITNLLKRHPMLKNLIHRPGTEASNDPYDVAEVDPAKTNAFDSSLWEIKTLQNHANPDVSRKAKIINQELSKIESDLSKMIDITTCSLYLKERKRGFTEAPMAIQKQLPDTLWLL